MRRWKIWTGLFLLFFAGVVSGIIGTILITLLNVNAVLARGPENIPALLERHLTRRLSLNIEQKKQIAPLIKEAHAKLVALQILISPQLVRVIDSYAGQVRTHLNHKQQEDFDAWLKSAKKFGELREQYHKKLRDSGYYEQIGGVPELGNVCQPRQE